MKTDEFSKLVKDIDNRVMNLETSHLYKHFDTTNKGYIAKEDFMLRFNDEIAEQ